PITDMLIHMRVSRSMRPWRVAVCCGLMTMGMESTAQLAGTDQAFDNQTSAEVTNVHQIRLLATQIPKTSYSIRVEGDVWWVNPTLGKLVLKDASGAEELEMDLHGESVESGQRVL